tara:strand:- start:1905 stop:2525 length:621 start_codon:yes stop_codon:yes gene_type:complete
MNYITDFYKLLLLILCLLVLFVTLQNFNLEFFQNNQTSLEKPEMVEFKINKINNNLELNWEKNVREIISKYIIIIYINNQGPYLKIIDAKTKDRYFSYVYKNIENGTIYKIGLVAVNDQEEMSDINIKEFESKFEKDTNKYSHRFNSKILCDPNGQHRIVDKCQSNKHDIIATDKLSDDSTFYFDETEHEALMERLNKKTRFNFKI